MHQKIWLKKGKEKAILRKHHWIFSGAIHKMKEQIENGTLADVYNQDDHFVCRGMYHDANIAFRILTFKEEAIDQAFWDTKISTAFTLRNQLEVISSENNVFRLFHGEGDSIPGLVIDIYLTTAVIQLHYPGLEQFLDLIQEAITKIDLQIDEVIIKKTYHEKPKTAEEENIPILCNELGVHFNIYPITGQKTGFFIDQRDNRKLVSQYASGKSVLNLFSYTGGFTLHALKGGASKVVSIDISQNAMDVLAQNLESNHIDASRHESLTTDVMEYITTADMNHDIIIVDPPAFAKHKSKRHNAIQAYKRLNLAVFSKAKPGALVFTFSCSQVITKDIFRSTIYAAALESNRNIKVIRELNQSADHPVNIFHPETDYLKGLLLYIE